ncbi:Syntaxin-17 [Camponotus floridanus]|uniref:Syntaxin-17 n=1 Tax=Camponotus floridanus TaxID=104421 RepID=E2A6D6_CAMFO|nr:Syntaxin-17 [Camponotus floridanus]
MSALSESITIKQPIRRLEIQINNFNVAIPHHVNLLKRHKNNIKKYQNQHDWERMRKEHINVSRIIKQLKELLYQMETLRAQVLDVDIDKFDKLTRHARTSIMCTIEEYLEMELDASKLSSVPSKNEDQETKHSFNDNDIQLQVEREDLQYQQTCIRVWNCLQEEIQQLHELFTEFNKIVHVRIYIYHFNLYLGIASKYKVAAYPIAGAMLGTCIGGPIGLLAGMKIGGLAALSCGILGFTGGSLLKKKQIESQKHETCANTSAVNLKNVKKSISCPDNLKEDKKDL